MRTSKPTLSILGPGDTSSPGGGQEKQHGDRYDGARLAIGMLNEHGFADWLPGLDLGQAEPARRALDTALDIATRRDSAVYALGEHTGLVSRVMEWLWSDAAEEHVCALRGEFIARARRAVGEHDGTSFGLMWKSILAAAGNPRKPFSYDPVDVRGTARRRHRELCANGDEEAGVLEQYVQRNDGLDLSCPTGSDEGLRGTEIVIVCPIGWNIEAYPQGAMRMTLEVASHLLGCGAHVLLAGLAGSTFGFLQGIPFLGAADDASLMRLLTAMGPMDTVIGVARTDALVHARSARYLVYHHNPAYFPGGVGSRMLNALGVRVACVSRNTREALGRAGVRKGRVTVVPNCMDGTFSPNGDSGERAPHGLLFVGGIAPYKRVDRAVRAFELIRERFPGATLDIYGPNFPGWSAEPNHLRPTWITPDGQVDWQAVMRDVPGIAYHGEANRKEVAAAFGAHSLLVLPSDGDDFPLVSLEAQACGCIPVLPRAGGMPETVREGETGFVYEPNTPEALARAIEQLWDADLPSERQRTDAGEWIPATFSRRRTGRAFAAVVAAAPRFGLWRRALLKAYRGHRRVVNKLQRLGVVEG